MAKTAMTKTLDNTSILVCLECNRVIARGVEAEFPTVFFHIDAHVCDPRDAAIGCVLVCKPDANGGF